MGYVGSCTNRWTRIMGIGVDWTASEWRPNLWYPTRGDARVRWLPDDEFDKLAKENNIPITKSGFAVWKQHWWQKDQIVLRARRLDLFAHEVRHIEERRNFHED